MFFFLSIIKLIHILIVIFHISTDKSDPPLQNIISLIILL